MNVCSHAWKQEIKFSAILGDEIQFLAKWIVRQELSLKKLLPSCGRRRAAAWSYLMPVIRKYGGIYKWCYAFTISISWFSSAASIWASRCLSGMTNGTGILEGFS